MHTHTADTIAFAINIKMKITHIDLLLRLRKRESMRTRVHTRVWVCMAVWMCLRTWTSSHILQLNMPPRRSQHSHVDNSPSVDVTFFYVRQKASIERRMNIGNTEQNSSASVEKTRLFFIKFDSKFILLNKNHASCIKEYWINSNLLLVFPLSRIAHTFPTNGWLTGTQRVMSKKDEEIK